MVIGTGSHSAPVDSWRVGLDLASSRRRRSAPVTAARSLRLRKIVDSLLPLRISPITLVQAAPHHSDADPRHHHEDQQQPAGMASVHHGDQLDGAQTDHQRSAAASSTSNTRRRRAAASAS